MKYIKNRKGPFPNNDNVKWETLDGKDAVVWDSWIAGQDDDGNYILYAMTDSGPGLEKRIKVEGQHHVAFLTAWKTNDFTHFKQVNQEVLFSNPDGPDNACIWSGSVIKTKVPDADGKKYVQGYALFYTSRTIIGAGPTDRNTELDQGFQIAIVRGDHLNGDEKWERIEGFRMVADPEIHELMTDYNKGYECYGKRVCYEPKSISAFRDPYPFFINEGNKKEVYVAVSTKKKFCPAENREMINNNGSITIYHVVDGDLANLNAYEYIDQFTPVEDGSAGYQEMECPHVYYSNEEGCLLLIYSTSGRPTRAKNCKTKPGQLHAVRFRISNGHFEKIGGNKIIVR